MREIFFMLALVKTKQRNRLDAEAQLRVSKPSLIPRLPRMQSEKQ